MQKGKNRSGRSGKSIFQVDFYQPEIQNQKLKGKRKSRNSENLCQKKFAKLNEYGIFMAFRLITPFL